MENDPKIVTLMNGETLVAIINESEHNVQLYRPVKVDNFRVQTEDGITDATTVKKWIAYSSDEYYNISRMCIITISNLREDLADKYLKFTESYVSLDTEDDDPEMDELEQYLPTKAQTTYLH